MFHSLLDPPPPAVFTILDAIWIVAGLALLIMGAELLIRGASRLAAAFNVPPIIIGLTIVSFGTGAPELVVGVSAAFQDAPGIALGNVVGSNIINVLAVLGLSAAVAPLVVASRLVRLDVPIMIGVSIVLLLMALNGRIETSEGAVLVAAFLAYVVFLFARRRFFPHPEATDKPVAPEGQRTPLGLARDAAITAAGGAILAVGANRLVDGGSKAALELGVSEMVIGLTIVAVGTSLPELVTSIVAAIKGQRDIAVGNVVGSNIFNILAVAGSSALAGGGLIVESSAINFDIPVMLAASAACFPVFLSGYRIERWEGWLFVGYFLAYMIYLIFRASGHGYVGPFSPVMAAFVFPLIGVTLLVLGGRMVMGRRGQGAGTSSSVDGMEN